MFMEDKKTLLKDNCASVEETPRNLWPMSGESIAAILNKIALAEKMIASIREQAKQMLQNGIDVPGWRLKPGAKREVITEPQIVYERFIALGGKHDAFMETIKVSKGELRLAINETTGARGAALDNAVKMVCEDCVEVKQNEPSLERIKE